MNNTSMLMYFANQMLAQAPILLVYLFGIILCAMRWQRAPKAAMLALIGTGVMLLTTLVFGFMNAYLITNQINSGTPISGVGQSLAFLSMGASILRAAGFALVLAAVFAQRGNSGHGFDVTPRSSVQST